MQDFSDFAVCAFMESPSLWIVRWSPGERTLEAFPSEQEITHAFALAADPVTGGQVLTQFDENGSLIFLRAGGTAEHPDLTPVEQMRFPGVSGPCRSTVFETGVGDGSRMLAVAGYYSGNVALIDLDRNGLPLGRMTSVQFTGSGPDPERQNHPYIHDVMAMDGVVWAADLGADLIRRITVDSGQELAPVRCPAGSGPRHIANAGERIFVASGELDSTLMLFRRTLDDNGFELADSISSTSRTIEGRNYPSSVIANPDTGLVYLANRGAETVLTASVADGWITVLSETPTGGIRPEHMALQGDHLLVAHSTDGAVTALQLEAGLPTGEISAQVTIPGAIWIEPHSFGYRAESPRVKQLTLKRKGSRPSRNRVRLSRE